MSATLPGGRPVDIELLADFAEGLLTPSQANEVRQLIDADPAWASTLTMLDESAPAVAAALAAYAEDTAGAMPTEVAARLTSALAEVARGRESQPSSEPLDADPHGAGRQGPADNRPGRGGGGTRPPTVRTPSGRSGSRTLWTRLALVSVFVLAVVGVGFLVRLAPSTQSNSTSSGSALAAPDVRLPELAARPGLTVTASGTQYSASTSVYGGANSSEVPRPTAAGSGGGVQPLHQTAKAVSPDRAPAALGRLTSPAALEACLEAVETSVGGTTRSVDFASYDGAPALIVVLDSPPRAVAVDPNCGLDGNDDQIAMLKMH